MNINSILNVYYRKRQAAKKEDFYSIFTPESSCSYGDMLPDKIREQQVAKQANDPHSGGGDAENLETAVQVDTKRV